MQMGRDAWASRAGLTTKKNGMAKAIRPSLKLSNPVFMGSVPAIPAAAKAAKQTGGVMLENTPKKKGKK